MTTKKTPDSPWEEGDEQGGSGPWGAHTEALVRSDHALIRQVRLVVLDGPDLGAVFESTNERCRVGTHKSNDFVLKDSTVSRFHCEIEFNQGRALIRDLESRNGTIIDGVRMYSAPLEEGSTLTLGRTQVRFELAAGHVKIPLSEKHVFGGLVGQSTAMRQVFAVLERAAASDVTVLFQGETGTGKGLAAESLHQMSRRSDGPFVVVDCGAIPPNLAESELFGHEKGAFTGADQQHAGAFESADGGTIFLDEIGELLPDLQPKLLRALENRTVRRVGGTQPIPIDVRVIAATNRPLQAEVNAHRFRSDLFYRLAVLEIKLPNLRDRIEDMPLLAQRLVERGEGTETEAARKLLSPEFLANLQRHAWPGNIRELRNYIERCLALQDILQPMSFGAVEQGTSGASASVDISVPLRESRDRWVRTFEREYLKRLLDANKGNVSAAARAAQVDRVHFYRLLSRAGLR